MPYVDEAARRELADAGLGPVLGAVGLDVGRAAYVVFCLLDRLCWGPRKWERLASAYGSVVLAAEEWKRHAVDPHEDDKRRLNGGI